MLWPTAMALRMWASLFARWTTRAWGRSTTRPTSASNKSDGDRAQAGNVIFMGGGPLEWRSYRIHHAGLSALNNEYSALAVVSQAITWLRCLLEDLGLMAEIDDPRAFVAQSTLTADPEYDVRIPPDRRHDLGNVGWDNSPKQNYTWRQQRGGESLA